ncbi:MAG: HEAT repeat domain-containing protein [Nocardioidaceae bacterium]
MARLQPSDLRAHPRDLVAEALREYGEHAVIDCCLALLEGEVEYASLPVPMAFFGMRSWADAPRAQLTARDLDFWPRTWGARGLLYAWMPYAEPGVVRGLGDRHWRVREMCAKVVVHRELGSAADVLIPLVDDEVTRVRVAAIRALALVGEYEGAQRVVGTDVSEPTVRVAAAAALRALRLRLDRTIEAQ